MHVCSLCLCLQVFNQLGGRYSREQVTNALNSLVSEAHLYNTVDDFHYKSATTA